MKWLKRVIVVLLVTFALFYLVTRPEGAADAVKAAGNAIAGAFDAIMKFFTELSK